MLRRERRLFHVHMVALVAIHASDKGRVFNLLTVRCPVLIYSTLWYDQLIEIPRLFIIQTCFRVLRVVRAFLIEEQKIVKKVLAEKSKKPKKSDA
jgi:hypothetical protein